MRKDLYKYVSRFDRAKAEAKALNEKIGSKIKVTKFTTTFLNDPIISKRIERIRKRNVSNKNQEVLEDSKKYFIERKGITYASGICVKKYNENK